MVCCGCHDSEGRRVSADQWWNSRFSSDKPKATGGRGRDENRFSDGSQRRGGARSGEANGSASGEMDGGSTGESAGTAESGGGATLTSGTLPQAAVTSDVLVINDETLAVIDVVDPVRGQLEEAARNKPGPAYLRYRNDLMRRQVIEAVAERLIWQEARHQLSDEMRPQLDKIIAQMEKERINREFAGLETNYEKHLARTGRSRDEVHKQLERGLIVDRFLKDRLLPLIPSPMRNDLKKYYEQNRAAFTSSGRRELYMIDIPIAAFLEERRVLTDAQIQAARDKAKSQADEAAKQIASGRSFEDVARQYSKGLKTEEGGAWGFITEPLQGRWETPSKRVFQLNSGQVSEIIEAEKSFFIVKAGRVENTTTVSFADAQPQLMQRWRQERFIKLRGEFLQKRYSQAQVGSLDAFFQRVLAACPEPAGGDIRASR